MSPADPPGPRLVEASAAGKQERDRHAFEAWGSRLTLAQFEERELALRAHPWSAAAMRTWFLEAPGGRVLSSCETFATPCRFEGRWGEAYQVASVFTEETLRGQGHATRLLDLLVERLARAPGWPLAVTLYSDVGARQYARSGFRALPAFDWFLTPLEADPGAGVDALFGEEDLARELAALTPPDSRLLLWPDASQLDWHLERERLYARLLGGARPQACGARAGGARAFWAANAKDATLEVLLIAGADATSLAALLQAARGCAAGAGLAQVRLWEDRGAPDPSAAARALGGERRARDGGLPMLAPLHPGVDAGDWSPVLRGLWV